MMKEITTLNPWLSESKNVIGFADIKNMPNLLSLQTRESGIVSLNIQLGNTRRKDVLLEINIKTRLNLICQRCMELIKNKTFDINSSFLISKEEVTQRTNEKDVDTIICEKNLDITSLVEQELILAIPMIPKHKSCETSYINNLAEAEPSPFAELVNIKFKN